MIGVMTQNRLNYVQSEIKSALEAVSRLARYVDESPEGALEERDACRSDAIQHLNHARRTLEQLQGQR